MRSSTPSRHKKRLRTNKSSPATPPPLKPRTSARPASAVPPPLPAGSRADLLVQDCCFVQWDVSGVCAVAVDRRAAHIALARLNGAVELRARRVDWAVVAMLPGHSAPERTVSDLKFSACGRYVLLARLDGTLAVLAVSQQGLAPHVELTPGGGAVWAIAVEPEGGAWALACDDGCVRFVRVEGTEEGAESLPKDPTKYVVRASDTTEARVLSVAWAPPVEGSDVHCVVCGDSEGGVRWIDPANGKVYSRGKVPKVRGESTALWTVQFVRGGNEVVCGDSRGMATVWTSATATMRQEVRIEGLQNALWSSTVVRDAAGEELVFFGSAAGGVGALRPVEDVWMPCRGTRFHSHDVRGLASFEGGVVSGSFDARICVFSPADFVDRRDVTWILPYHGCVGQPPVQFSRNARFVLARRSRGIDLWGLPDDSSSPPLKLRMKLKSFQSDLISCAISGDGDMMAAAGLGAFRLYQVWDGEGNITDSPTFGKVNLIEVGDKVEGLLEGAWDLAFCGKTLVCILKSKKKLALYQDGNTQIISMADIGSEAFSLERIACVSGGLAIADSLGNVFCSQLEPDWFEGVTKLEWRSIFSPESGVLAITAFSFAPSGASVSIATSDFKVFITQTENSDADKTVSVGPFEGVITSLSYAESEESLLISGEKFCSVMCTMQLSKKRRHNKDSQVSGFDPYKLRVGDSVLGTCVLSTSKIAVVRRRWELVQSSSSLPDAIPKKPFGR